MSKPAIAQAVETVRALVAHLEAGAHDQARACMKDDGMYFDLAQPNEAADPEFGEACAVGDAVIVPTILTMEGARRTLRWVCVEIDGAWKVDMGRTIAEATGKPDPTEFMRDMQQLVADMAAATARQPASNLQGDAADRAPEEAAGETDTLESDEPISAAARAEYDRQAPQIHKDVADMIALLNAYYKVRIAVDVDWASTEPCLDRTIVLGRSVDRILKVLNIILKDGRSVDAVGRIHLAYDRREASASWAIDGTEARGRIGGSVATFEQNGQALVKQFEAIIG